MQQRTADKISRFVQQQLLWILLTFSIVALCWQTPTNEVDVWNPFLATKPALSYIFACTMFCIGCLLRKEEVDQLFASWPTVLCGTAIQYVSMPLLAFVIAQVFGLEGSYLLGVIMVGCVPGAMASNVITLAAKGNVSYSVSLTTSATILSPFIVPFVLVWLTGADPELETALDEKMKPIPTMIKLIMTVAGPVIAGHLVCRWLTRFAESIRPCCGIIANATIIWIIAVVVAMNRGRLVHLDAATDSAMLAALLLLNCSGYLAGYLGGRLVGLQPDMRRALALEVGMQNAGLGTLLALAIDPVAAIPTGVYTFGCMFTGISLAKWWARRNEESSEDS